MKIPVSRLRSAIREREDQEPQPPVKRARHEPAPSAAPGTSAAAEAAVQAPVPSGSIEEVAPEPTVTEVEEGEMRPTPPDTAIVVLDGEDEEDPPAQEAAAMGPEAAAEELPPPGDAEQAAEIRKTPPPNEARPAGQVEEPPAPTGDAEQEASVAPGGQRRGPSGPRSKRTRPREGRGDGDTSSHRPERRGTPAAPLPTTGRVGRHAPLLTSMRDVVEACSLLSRARNTETDAEMGRLSCADALDSLMVNILQISHCAFSVRAGVSGYCDKLAAAIARANKYKELSRSQGATLARSETERKAEQERHAGAIREAENRLSAEKIQTAAAEASLRVESQRREVAVRKIEDLKWQLRQAEEQTQAALNEAGAVKAKLAEAMTVAEAAVRDKGLAESHAAEAVAHADNTVRRAQEAEASIEEARARVDAAEERARYAQTEVEEARARAASAVAEYKASADFEQEVVEGSLDAFAEGFKLGKSMVAAAFNINPSDVEGIRAGDDGVVVEEEEDAVAEAAGEETEKKAAAEKP